MAPPRRRRGRAALILLGVAIALPAAGWVGLNLLLRDEVLRPRLIAAVEQATGRALTLSGPVGIKLSLVPTVTLEGVALANAPGGSRPQMLTARRVEAELALLPLLRRRLAFERVTLIEPDLLLELNAEGTPNWRFGPPRPAGVTAAPASTPAAPAGEPLALTVAAIDIEGGRIGWRDHREDQAETLEIRKFRLEADSPEAPMRFEGRFGFHGVAVAAEGSSGPLAQLTGATASSGEWPLRLALAAPGVQLVAQGSLAQPDLLGGWRLTLDATAEDTQRLAPFLGPLLPPARGLDLSLELVDAGAGALPRVNRLHLRSTDVMELGFGLRLGATTISIAAPGEPVALAAALTLRGLPLRAELRLPTLERLQEVQKPGPQQPIPFRLTLNGEGLEASAEGQWKGGHEAELDLSFSARDTAALSAALAMPLPRLTEARLGARLTLSPQRSSLEALRLDSRQLQAEGEATWQEGDRPALTARLAAQRVDLDALLRAPPPPAAPAPATPPAAPAPPPRPAPAAPPPGPRRVIPALPVDPAPLRGFDAQLALTVAEALAGGVTYRDLRATMKLGNGLLAVEPLSLGLPGGRLSGRLGLDGSGEVPRLSLALRHEGSGLDLRPLLQAYGLPAQASGRLELEADLSGSGADTRQIAASGNGTLALAMANGQVDNRLIATLAGDLRRLLLPNAPSEGGTALRCLALRLQLRDGIARPQAMLVETSLADVVGSGEFDLREERLALRLLPQIRLGGLGLSAPVLVGGSFAAPSYRLDPAGVPEAAAGIVGDLVARQRDGQGGILGQLAQQLAGRQAGGLPDCAQQLAVARNGRGGPVPAEAPQRRNSQERSNPVDLLRGLLGR
ncbi:AsmA family protein [Pseudoroseomonas cervicalis]|uniref:AsmA family protein n=1 Tax=Teichococcus cervicalis TaxID=204525 RepID=UPI0022F19A4E|nr:AsmA family protein [Pseudoroseomonas cervicalis]WBV41703.1 AsmA family protein [Pseudoroseomonas cervicalis]